MASDFKIILKILISITAFYIGIMLVWNFTNVNHKPTNLLWDVKKEGYQEDPLHDRYKIQY
jgi:hypothetical protein